MPEGRASRVPSVARLDRRRRFVVALLLVVACTREPLPGDVLLVTVDTLRADRVGLCGSKRPTTPNLDRWFGGGRLYRRAYSTSASTPASVVSLLSGQLPQHHRTRAFFQRVNPELPLVPHLLPPQYQRAAFVSNVVLSDRATGLAAHFDHYDDEMIELGDKQNDRYERTASPTTDAVLAWLDAERDPARPLFLWVHYMDPHGPYRPPPSWQRSFDHPEPLPIDRKRIPPSQRVRGLLDGLAYVDLYDEEVAYVDSEIGRLLDGYAARHPVDRTLLIFTADHGESLMEHEGWFRHGYNVYDEIVRVPLMLRGPGVRPGVVDALASGTDVAPTILRFVGIGPPADMPAVDLASGGGLDEPRDIFVESMNRFGYQWRAVVSGRTKSSMVLQDDLIGEGCPVKNWRVYDLATDPFEKRPRRRSKILTSSQAKLLALCEKDPDPAGRPRPKQSPEVPGAAPTLDPEAHRQLEALGYVE